LFENLENHCMTLSKKLYKILDYLRVSLNFLRSKYNHFVYFESLKNGTFIFLVLYLDDILIAIQNMFSINKLKAQLAKMFHMKNLGVRKQIFNIGVHKDEKNGKLWLSKQQSMEKY
jgi:hypothetical protein